MRRRRLPDIDCTPIAARARYGIGKEATISAEGGVIERVRSVSAQEIGIEEKLAARSIKIDVALVSLLDAIDGRLTLQTRVVREVVGLVALERWCRD